MKINDNKKPKMSITEKGRFKVAYVHFRGDYDIKPLAGIDVEIMPLVIDWVMKECSFHALYHLVRNWDVATLFGFPLAEKKRLSSHSKELEKRNKELEEHVKKLRDENAELKEEVSVLKKDKASSRKKQKLSSEGDEGR